MVTFFVLIASFTSGTAAFATQGVTEDKILVGSHTALSGPAAVWGVSAVNAIRLHFETVNSAGGIHGRKLQLIAEDHGYQVPRAIQAANKLINRDKVFAMLSALGTPTNNAVLQQQLSRNVPNVFPYTAARSMGEPFHRLKFAGGSTYYDQTRSGLKYFISEKGKESICVMYQGTDFGQESVDAVNDQLASMGMKITDSFSYKPTDTEFVTGVMKMKKAGCDLVVLGSILGDTIRIVATARKLGWGVEFMGNIASYDQIVIAKAPAGVTNGYYAMTSFVAQYEDTASGEAKSFLQKYREKYNAPASMAAQLAFSFASTFTHALEKAGRNLTLDSFVDAMESVRNFNNPMGGPPLSLSATNHQATNASMLAQIQGDRWVIVAGPLSY